MKDRKLTVSNTHDNLFICYIFSQGLELQEITISIICGF